MSFLFHIQGNEYYLQPPQSLATFEEMAFYVKQLGRQAVVHKSTVYFPALFGLPAWSQVLPAAVQDEPSSPLSCVHQEQESYIYLGNIGPRNYLRPLQKITDFNISFCKTKLGKFRLSLVLNKVAFETIVPLKMNWTEFAFFMDFALTHGKVIFTPLLRILTIDPCLGVKRHELKLN